MSVKWQDYVEERKDVMMGKPVFKDTRLTVQHVLEELAVLKEREGGLAPVLAHYSTLVISSPHERTKVQFLAGDLTTAVHEQLRDGTRGYPLPSSADHMHRSAPAAPARTARACSSPATASCTDTR